MKRPTSKAKAGISQRAYARHRGTSVSAVQKAIATGRITLLRDGTIDAESADAAWAQNTEVQAPGIGSRRQRALEEDNVSALQYTKARAVREHYQARLAKMEFEEKAGTLVQSDETLATWLNIIATVKTRLMMIPDNLRDRIAPETNPIRCGEMIAAEIRAAMEELAATA